MHPRFFRYVFSANTLFSSESAVLLEAEDFLDSLRAQQYDYAIVDATFLQYTLVPYKLSIPYAVLGISLPEFVRRIPYMPR